MITETSNNCCSSTERRPYAQIKEVDAGDGTTKLWDLVGLVFLTLALDSRCCFEGLIDVTRINSRTRQSLGLSSRRHKWGPPPKKANYRGLSNWRFIERDMVARISEFIFLQLRDPPFAGLPFASQVYAASAYTKWMACLQARHGRRKTQTGLLSRRGGCMVFSAFGTWIRQRPARCREFSSCKE